MSLVSSETRSFEIWVEWSQVALVSDALDHKGKLLFHSSPHEGMELAIHHKGCVSVIDTPFDVMSWAVAIEGTLRTKFLYDRTF